MGSFYCLMGRWYDSFRCLGLVLPQSAVSSCYRQYTRDKQLKAVSDVEVKVKKELEGLGVTVKFDDRETHKPGWKFAEYELKGVPLRLSLGNRDLENDTIEIARRDTMEKEIYQISNIGNKVVNLLDKIQENLYIKAENFREENTFTVNTFDEFKEGLKQGGFIYAHWDGTAETEEKIKQETKATIRCIPQDISNEEGICIYSGKRSVGRVLFAKAY